MMFGLLRFSSWLYDESKFYAAAWPSMMPLDIADIADGSIYAEFKDAYYNEKPLVD